MLDGRGVHVQVLALDHGAQEPALELARSMGCKIVRGQAGGLSGDQFPCWRARAQGGVCEEDLQVGGLLAVVVGVANVDDEGRTGVLLQQLDYADGAQQTQRVAPVASVGRRGARQARPLRAPSAGGGRGGGGGAGRAWGTQPRKGASRQCHRLDAAVLAGLAEHSGSSLGAREAGGQVGA